VRSVTFDSSALSAPFKVGHVEAQNISAFSLTHIRRRLPASVSTGLISYCSAHTQSPKMLSRKNSSFSLMKRPLPRRSSSSSIKGLLQKIRISRDRSSPVSLTNPLPGTPSASNVFTSLVRYRSALPLVSNPSISNIPVAKTPVPECQIGYGPVLAAFSTCDTEQLCVRVIDDN
jgi:hypothetical protein